MAKRFTDTDLWDKEWFMELSMKHKLLIKLLFAKCDVAGVWSPNWALASSYIGEKVNKSDLEILAKHIEFLPDGRIFVVDFVSFQYGVLTEKCAPHRKIIALLKKYGLFERVSVGYRKGIDTLQEEEEDKEEDKEKEKGKEEDKKPPKANTKPKQSELTYPFTSELFMQAWAAWKDYKKKEHSFKYKTTDSEQAALMEISELSNGNETTAFSIIKQSMSNGWKGLFELKNQTGYGQSQQGTGKVFNAAAKDKLAERMANLTNQGQPNPNGDTFQANG